MANSKYLDIAGKRILVREDELSVRELKFYEDNPRVYSLLHSAEEFPTQEQIEEFMLNMEHVKELRGSIESVGLIDPLIVRDGDFVVLEGNSRLAAYRKLARKDIEKWGKVKCQILPHDIDQDTVLTILGQYHIVGRKDWSPFEQAGFILRGLQDTKYPIDELAKKMGISITLAKNYIRVYNYMVEQNDVAPAKWSYYEEFLKNRSIKHAVEEDSDLEMVIVNKIKKGEIHEASDIRKIGELVKQKSKPAKKITKQFKEGKVSLQEAYTELKDTGQIDEAWTKFNKFKEYISDTDFDEKVLEMNQEMKNKLLFEIRQIMKRLKSIQENANK